MKVDKSMNTYAHGNESSSNNDFGREKFFFCVGTTKIKIIWFDLLSFALEF